MSDDRPSIAELQRLAPCEDGDCCSDARASLRNAAPVLLEIAAAVLAWVEHPHGDNYQRLAATLHKVLP